MTSSPPIPRRPGSLMPGHPSNQQDTHHDGKKTGLSDDELVQTIYSDLAGGIKFADSELSAERSLALQYYYGELPRRLHKGSSGYRSLDVYDQVEQARAMILETFTGAELPLKITPGRNKVAGAVHAALATQYVNHVLFTRNDGEAILDQVIFDALMARIGVVRVDWQEDSRIERQRMEGLTMDQVDMLAMEEDVTEILIEEETPDGVASATVSRKVDTSFVKVTQVRPEDFLVNTAAADEYEYTVAHRLTKRLSVWRAEGYAEEDLLKALSEDERSIFDEEAQARNDAGAFDADSRDADPFITLIDAYLQTDMEGDGTIQMWRVLLAGRSVLEREPVDDHPFVVYRPIRVPHIYHGVQFVKTIIPTANAKTALTRSIIDHAMRTNNPRYTVLRGTFNSPRELLENRFGGIVNIDKPDGIQPLPQASMNPFVFESIKLLDTDLSDTTGISRLSQGVDKDVISKQNSRGMMADMAHASETRMRILARRFANGFLKQLAAKTYRVAVANDTAATPCVVNGEEVEVRPAEWPSDLDITVSLELAPEQKERRVGQIMELLAVLQQDPALGQTLDYGYKRKMAVEALKLRGWADAERALSPEPPKPDPMQQRAMELDLQAKEIELQLQQRNAEVARMKAETERLKVIKTLEADERRLMLDHMRGQAQMALNERKQAANEAATAFEKQILREKMAQDPEGVKGIASLDT
ncbi:MAG: hypothetical protein J7D61_07785 [Marichromatium sp.]|nr:hypothetical protein [Marichromatium sp.]